MNELINMEEEANYNRPMEFVPGSTISREIVELRDRQCTVGIFSLIK